MIDWLFSHMDDPSLDEPLPSAAPAAAASEDEANEEGIAMLMSMGIMRNLCVKALKACNNDMERAVEWVFSHQDEMDVEEAKPAAKKDAAPEFAPSSSRARSSPLSNFLSSLPGYRLFAFITHMGSNTASGHYVAHINVDGKWCALLPPLPLLLSFGFPPVQAHLQRSQGRRVPGAPSRARLHLLLPSSLNRLSELNKLF